MRTTPPVKSSMVLSLFFWAAQPAASLGDDLSNFDRKIDPIEISGDALPQITGATTENIRVFASRNKQLLPIPFQIDQKTSEGDWVWTTIPKNTKRDKAVVISVDDDYDVPPAQARDLTVDDQDPPGQSIFDSNDVLVFMASDVGDRNTKAIDEPDVVMVELKI